MSRHRQSAFCRRPGGDGGRGVASGRAGRLRADRSGYEDLPAIVDPEAALAPGAPQLHDDVPGNCPFEAESGDEAAVTEAIAKAAHVTKLKVDCTRVTPARWSRARR